MKNKSIPQAASPLASWLSYLENLHSKSIDLGLERVSQVAARLDILKPAPFVFTVAGTNGKGTTCRTLESVLIAADTVWASIVHLIWYVTPSACACRGKN
ncbi:folylpolyglutamate synthase [Salmonella enterica subsp. enterica]|uniref:Folylpolyglutamate synthase n=1 Tax=Salmonella enterica I TaxID=59201 RepID=A0A379W632_SALET|nr:folylpolyglutamate synthase [Salmonella enterica subsp. enterica]